jgi:hypothetical protein
MEETKARIEQDDEVISERLKELGKYDMELTERADKLAIQEALVNSKESDLKLKINILEKALASL